MNVSGNTASLISRFEPYAAPIALALVLGFTSAVQSAKNKADCVTQTQKLTQNITAQSVAVNCGLR